MRIAAGVLFIIAALFDFAAGATWGFLGGAATMATQVGQGLPGDAKVDAGKIIEQINKDIDQKIAEAKTPEEKKALELGKKMAIRMIEMKGALFGYGIFLLVLGGLAIAAAVCLFRAKAAMFVIIVALLQIGAEAFTLWLKYFNPTWFDVFGIFVGVFAIIAALTYPKMSSMSDR